MSEHIHARHQESPGHTSMALGQYESRERGVPELHNQAASCSLLILYTVMRYDKHKVTRSAPVHTVAKDVSTVVNTPHNCIGLSIYL